MSAQKFFLPYRAAAKLTGIGVPNAKAYFFLPGTTTLTTVYSNQALTTPRSNPVIADGAGQFPSIWGNTALTYDLLITDKDGAEIVSKDSYIFGTIDEDALAAYQDAAAASATASASSATAAANSATAAGTSATNAANSATAAATSATNAASSATAAASSASSAATSATNAANSASTILSIPNAAQPVATRTAMAALSGTALTFPALLTEAGREGVFVWDSSNLQTLVTADTQKGIYVPPTGGNGSTGAWVRKFDGPVQSNWFGVAAAATAANNSTYMAAAIATVKARAVTGVGYATGGEELHTKIGNYSFSTTITADFAIHLTGDFAGMFGGGGTIFNFPAGQDGIYLTKDVGYARVEGLSIRGASATPGSGKHGLKCRGKVIASRLYINGFDHGIDCYGAFAGDGSNTNGSSFKDIACQGNVWGTWADGTDANNILFDNVACIGNALGGHMDSSFLGNIYVAGDISTNGGANQATYKNRCERNGSIFMCLKGQETWCSTNAPPTTASSNQGWLYVGSGVANAGYQPTWTTGQTWYFSAPFAMDPDNNNARTVFRDLYVEPDQNPAVMSWPGTYYKGFDTGRVITSSGANYGATIGANASGDFEVTGNFGGAGQLSGYGFATRVTGVPGKYVAFAGATGAFYVGSPSDPGVSDQGALSINSWGGTYCSAEWKVSGSQVGSILAATDGTLNYYATNSGTSKHQFNCAGGSEVVGITSAGVNLAAGAYKVAGTTVINSSGVIQAAAMPAHTGDVTSSAGSVALTIPNDTVTYAKIQNVSATDKLLGRSTAGAGDIEEITCTAAGRALIDDADATAQRTTLGAAASGLATASGLTMSTGKLLGRTTAATGAVEELSTVPAANFPILTGDVTTAGGSLATTIANNAVTYAKFQQVAANSLVGNPTGSTANAQGITLAGGLSFSGTTLTAAGALTPTSVASTGTITSSSATAGIGYASGAGGTVTQATSKATGVTLNKACGEITLNGAALASATVVSFVLTNSAIAAGDNIIINHVSVGTFGGYMLNGRCAAGSATIDVRNVTAGSLSEAIVLRYTVIKGATA